MDTLDHSRSLVRSMISTGLSNYAARTFNGIRFYVGYVSGGLQCRRYIGGTTTSLPFSDGTNVSLIATSSAEEIPLFDIRSDGVLVVDRPLTGGTSWVRHVSLDSGETWSAVA